MKNDSQADAVLRKTATLLHIKNVPNGAFFGCFLGFCVIYGQEWYESVGLQHRVRTARRQVMRNYLSSFSAWMQIVDHVYGRHFYKLEVRIEPRWKHYYRFLDKAKIADIRCTSRKSDVSSLCSFP